MLTEMWHALDGGMPLLDQLSFTGAGPFDSSYPVNALASASIGVAGLAIAEYAAASRPSIPQVVVDRALAGAWFSRTLWPSGWALPSLWDPIAGDYRSTDGWIRLHTNAPHHRAAALEVLGLDASKDVPTDRDMVATEVRRWSVADLETAVVGAGGCAAQLRSPAQWRRHPQGLAVAAEPLIGRSTTASPGSNEGHDLEHQSGSERPLASLRVLDLTRVLAGPVATRMLAGFGAEVLRIDPPGYDEPGIEAETTLGKRCARLDLRKHPDALLELVADADVVVHGYRRGALDALGLGQSILNEARPGLVEVTLNAYGWQGPWTRRRGFDSLVQMSSGIAWPLAESDVGVVESAPTPLPAQALDYGTGYLMAAAVARGLSQRRQTGLGNRSQLSLARTAAFLEKYHARGTHYDAETQMPDGDHKDAVMEESAWGTGRRLPGPVTIGALNARWDIPARGLGSSPPRWQA
ncbi:CoA transferase [Jatrophihabitans sp. DSM 45814]